jgi:hypothetical protein
MFASCCLGLQELIRITHFQMHAEVQLLSPLVPVRQVKILRFCKQHAEGVWAVVDVSVEIGHDAANAQPFISCRRLPSGCIVQDMPNGYSKVSANPSFLFLLSLHFLYFEVCFLYSDFSLIHPNRVRLNFVSEISCFY